MKKRIFAGPIGLVLLSVLSGCGSSNSASSNPSQKDSSNSAKDTVDSYGCSSSRMPFGGGAGSQNDPYLVCSTGHLEAMAGSDTPSYYALTRDLDMTNEKHVSLGLAITGVFDGQGHTIKNFSVSLEMDQENGYLFGQLHSTNALIAEIKNLNLENFTIRTHSHFGAATLLGSNFGGKITNVHATGTVTGRELVGGLVANNFGIIQDSSFSGVVEGETAVGGIAGRATDYYISNCSASGRASGVSSVGGIAGEVNQTFESRNNIVDATVTGTKDFGKLIGKRGY